MSHQITIQERRTPNPARFRKFRVHFFGHPITATVTSTPAVVQDWIREVRYIHHQRLSLGQLVVGLGVQWKPSNRPLLSHPAATLQLCVGHLCLVFQLLRADAIPEALVRFLAKRAITFVGIRNTYDSQILMRDYGLCVKTVDLRYLTDNTFATMDEMARRFLVSDYVQRLRWIGRSDWSTPSLSEYQVQYACVDAYISFRIGLRLRAWEWQWQLARLTFHRSCLEIFSDELRL